MSHQKHVLDRTPKTKALGSEQNILGPIVDDRVPRSEVTLSQAVTRAQRVGLKGGRSRSYSLADRMAARTTPDSITGCWNFSGCPVGSNGYGQIDRGGGVRAYAHRVAWELAHPGEPIPGHLRVLHSCDNPRCVNPDHLRLGTQAENMHESVQKKRKNVFGRQRLSAEDVHELRALAAQGVRQKDIAARFGIARHTVSGILHGHSWAHLPQRATHALGPKVQEPLRPFELPDSPFELVRHVELPIAGEIR